jgi:hypothetical protein
VSRTLKRPMFRRGGQVNDGIMTGLVDRKQYAEGPTQAEIYQKQYEDMFSKIQPTQPKFNLGQLGLNLASGRFAGDGALSNIVGSLQDPYSSFVKQSDALKNLDYQKRMTAATMGIKRAEAEAVAKAKAAGTSGLQKDYSPQRAYEDLVKSRTESAGKLQSFQKPNIEQKYARATAEYDVYILRNLRATQNETGKMIAANNAGFVPFDPKTQSFDYNAMRPGAFYYDPRIKVFVQRIPPSDDEEGGFFIYDKNTYAKRKLEQ